MQVLESYKVIPLNRLVSELYNINCQVTHRKVLFLKHTRVVKVISGEAFVGNKSYIEDYTEDGKRLKSTKVDSYEEPFILRFADETKDSFRVNPDYLATFNVDSYKLVAEIVDVVTYYTQTGSVKKEFINSDIVIGW